MKIKEFSTLIAEGVSGIVKKPILLGGSLILGIVLFIISEVGERIAINFQTTVSNVVWTILLAIVLLALVSYFLAGLIDSAFSKGKKRIAKEFVLSANKFWWKNFQIVFLLAVVSLLIGRVAHYGALFIGRVLNLGVGPAVSLFVVIYLVGLLGVLIFLTFSSFFLVKENSKVLPSIKRSIGFVKGRYFETLAVSVFLFIIYYLVDKIPELWGDFVTYIFVLPYAICVLARFVGTAGLKK